MEEVKRSRSIKKFTYRGKDCDTLLKMSPEEFV